MCHGMNAMLLKVGLMIGVLVFIAGCLLMPQDRHMAGAEHLPFSDLPPPVRDAWQRQYPEYTVTGVERVRETGHDEIFLIGEYLAQEQVVVTYDIQGGCRDAKVEPIDKMRTTAP